LTEKDRQDFAIVIAALSETFGRDASEATVYGYWLGLNDLPIDSVKDAASRALRSCKFMPTPAELRELAGIANVSDRALLAWSAVEKASSLGAYKSVDFDDPLINAAIRSMGGWPAILDKSQQDFDTWVRKDFIAAYQGFMRAGVDGDVCRPLPGLADTGTFDVHKIDGTIAQATLGVVRIETGLPATGRQQPRLTA
jgi:hypothetical protein